MRTPPLLADCIHSRDCKLICAKLLTLPFTMARKNRTPEEKARREKIRELLQMANIGSMEDIRSLFRETIAEFMENGLEAELDDELGYSKYDYKNKDTDKTRITAAMGTAVRRCVRALAM